MTDGHISKARRYRQIAAVLVKHGFGWLLAAPGSAEEPRRRRWPFGRRQAEPVTQPEHLRLALSELGATFIKLGQVLSTRTDLLPPDYIAELSLLQDAAPSVPYPEIAVVVATELGGPPEAVFRNFDPEPRAAASLGQVHAARLQDGTPVVVKVQRPGVDSLVEEDLAILASLARVAQRTERGRQYDIVGLLDEFAYALRNELDYTAEGGNADRMRENFGDDPAVHIPLVYWEQTSRRVLTLEDIEGIKISHLDELDAAGFDRHVIAERCAHIAIVQVLDHGFYHADPHPGNFFVRPDGSIGLMDFGLVGYVDEELRRGLLRFSLAVSRQDADRVIDELLAMGAAPGSVDRRALKRDVDRMLRHYRGHGLGEISAAQLLHQITSTARTHQMQLPTDLTLLVKVIVMDDGLGAMLDPGFNLMGFAQPYLKRFWRRTHSVRAMARRAREDAADLADMAIDLPRRLRRLSRQLDRGDFQVTTRMDVPHDTMRNFQRAANRIAVSVVGAGILVGLSVLALVYRPAASAGVWRLVPTALLGAAIVAGAWLTVALWRSER